MNYKLIKGTISILICCCLIFQSVFLVPIFAEDAELFDAVFYTPNDKDIINTYFIIVTGVVGPISDDELKEGGICISYELYDEERSYYRSDYCNSLWGTTEHVNSVLREGYLIHPPPYPGKHHFILSASTVDNAYVKEMTIYYEPCGNNCIQNELNLGPDEKCEQEKHL